MQAFEVGVIDEVIQIISTPNDYALAELVGDRRTQTCFPPPKNDAYESNWNYMGMSLSIVFALTAYGGFH